MIALLLLATAGPDLDCHEFLVSARVARRLWMPEEDRLYDNRLGNIDVVFTGVDSVLFSIEAAEGKFEPQALFEFDEADHLVHQVEYMFGDQIESEETRRYENGRIVGWKVSWPFDRPFDTDVVVAYDDAGRLLSIHRTADEKETFSGTVSYLPGRQVIVRTTEVLEGTKTRRSTFRLEYNDSGKVTKEWKQEDDRPEVLDRRYEYDDQGRITLLAFLPPYLTELYTQKLAYGSAEERWRSRTSYRSDGGLAGVDVSFFNAASTEIHAENWEYADKGSDSPGSRPVVISHRACDRDEQGWLTKYVQEGRGSSAALESISSLERDAKGTVIGWRSLAVSPVQPVVAPGEHVRVERKYRTMLPR
jgi:hypothetical protein